MLSTNYFQLFFLLISLAVFSQEKHLEHKVLKGESLYSISKKYTVSIAQIEALNAQQSKNLKPNTILLIPNKNNKVQQDSFQIEHQVAPKETLYSISKKYDVTVAVIKKANPTCDESNMKVGEVLRFLGKKPKVVSNSANTNLSKDGDNNSVKTENLAATTHEVLPKETKYGIAKKYGISISELESLNPSIKEGLSVGTILSLTSSIEQNTSAPTNEVVLITEVETVKQPVLSSSGEPYAVLIPIYEKADLPDKLVNRASDVIGTKYQSGGTGEGGFDCSGLIVYTFDHYDVKLPRTSTEQSRFGTTITAAEAQKGDLIFFSTNGSGSVNHVGLITEVIGDEIKFIHSSSSNGVMISSNKESYYTKAFKKITRVLK